MIDIQKLRTEQQKILCIGSYPAIIQSVLDFDFLSGKSEPSIVAILANGRKFERYFYGNKEIFIPVYISVEEIPDERRNTINLFLNLVSGRRVLNSTLEVLQHIASIKGGAVFAEDTPEKHSLELFQYAQYKQKFAIGPASVGLLIPKVLKLGAVGGVDARQFGDSRLLTPGNVAVFSASGGMTNEIIRVVARSGQSLSFALAFGGDRFPLTTPQEAFLAAERDPETGKIVYFGELGGIDEYDIANLLTEKRITKKVICYIAGVVSELFDEPPQFGHAKAMAKTNMETARNKREALKQAGALVPESFTQFVEMIGDGAQRQEVRPIDLGKISSRKHALISSGISGDKEDVPSILHEKLLSFAQDNSFAKIVASMFLGQKIVSQEVEAFVDFVLRLLVDHGPYVSGAVNTIITARAGKDLSASLAAGLLTVGPRFGGAINQAALNWLAGVQSTRNADEFVESFASRKEYIAGIGHRKYRVDLPDPRVRELLKFADGLEDKKYTSFALSVERVTASKKGNLILNVDGTIAAVLLDLLSEKEGYSYRQLKDLTDREFFNALFVLSRSVGFIAHFLDQKRIDEGLFRLSESDVLILGTED